MCTKGLGKSLPTYLCEIKISNRTSHKVDKPDCEVKQISAPDEAVNKSSLCKLMYNQSWDLFFIDSCIAYRYISPALIWYAKACESFTLNKNITVIATPFPKTYIVFKSQHGIFSTIIKLMTVDD